MIVTSKAVYNIRFLLQHLLEEQKDVEANVETCSDRANVMVWKAVLSVAELRDGGLVILLGWLNAEVVDLDINSMSHFKELDYILTVISDGWLHSSSWIPKSYHVVVDVRQI